MNRGSISLIAIIMLFVSFFAPCSAEALQAEARRFLLSGDVTLTYDRQWGDTTTRDRFRHEYNLVLDGYVVDPRLATFELNTIFTQWINNPGSTNNTYGFGADISLLNARAVRGPLRYFPQPIRLRFNYYETENSNSYNYGINFVYGLPGTGLAFFRNGKILSLERMMPSADLRNNGNADGENARKGLLIPFPRFYLDYSSSRSSYEISGSEETTDDLDFRAESFPINSEYRLEYRYHKQSNTGSGGTYESKDQWLLLQADYHWPDVNTARTFDLYNRFYYRSTDEASFTDLSTRGIWIKRLGLKQNDSLSITGSGSYSTSDTSSSYAGDITGSYTRNLSERLRNTVSASLGYGMTDRDPVPQDISVENSEDTYRTTVSDNLSYLLSKNLLLDGGVSAGSQENGTVYGLYLGLVTTTRILTSTRYSYMHSGITDDKRDSNRFSSTVSDSHRFSFDARMTLMRNAYLVSRNYYQLSDFEYGGREKQLSLRGDIFWYFMRYRLQLGAYYQSRKNPGGFSATDTSSTILQAVLSRSFKRLFFSARIVYTHVDTGLTTLEFEPQMTWAFRKVYLTARYNLRKTDYQNGGSGTIHRFYFMVQRTFERSLRPFF